MTIFIMVIGLLTLMDFVQFVMILALDIFYFILKNKLKNFFLILRMFNFLKIIL